MKQDSPSNTRPTSTWGFLTNHAHVLLCVARDPQSRAREIADQIGITERSTQGILADLIADGYVTRTKVGRRNHYKINPRGHLRHPVLRDLSIGPLIDVLTTDGDVLTTDGDVLTTDGDVLNTDGDVLTTDGQPRPEQTSPAARPSRRS